MKSLKAFFIFYVFLILSFFLYSYTQVDLSLTLSRESIFQTIEKGFQNIGWYQRTISTEIFLVIILLMILSYLYLLYLSWKNKISRKFFWSLLLLTTGILVFSYNAFSYDIFNYIFDAKIITFYHQNPYFHKALDFPSDPMLSFMRWTHNTYPYGPVWLAITVPLSYLGFNIFIPTFFLFKIAIGGFFLGSIYFLEKIIGKLDLKNKMFPLILFAFNPLVIIECLISSHNDIAMMFFALSGFYLFLKRKVVMSIIVIIISGLIKDVTAILLFPISISIVSNFLKIKIPEENFLRITVLSLIAGLLYIMTRIELQPWYLLWVFPFIVLLKPNKYVVSESIAISIGAVFTYFPVVYIGNYINGTPYKLEILPAAIILGLIIPGAMTIKAKLRSS
jgi:hypothetical protein